jgi:hypothetical protein
MGPEFVGVGHVCFYAFGDPGMVGRCLFRNRDIYLTPPTPRYSVRGHG